MWLSALMVVGGLVAYLLTPVDFPVLQAAGVVVSTALITVALFVHGAPAAPRLAVVALIVQTASIASTDSQSDARTSASIGVFICSYFAVVVLGRRRGLWAMGVLTALWVLVVTPNQLAVVFMGHSVNVRWLVLPQLVLSAGWLWRVWHFELDRMAALDARERDSHSGTIAALRAQERVAAWRSSAVRAHETILNDIRYVLSTPAIDSGRLREVLARPHSHGDLGTSHHLTLREAISAVSDASGIPRLEVEADETLIAPWLAESIRSVLVELLRNASRHADAREARIIGQGGSDAIELRVRHDGKQGIADSVTGIGLSIVVRETVAEVGGTMTSDAQGVTVSLPRARSGSTAVAVPLSTPSLVLSTVMAGNAVGGLGSVTLLFIVGTPPQRLAALLSLMSIGVGAVAAYRGASPRTRCVALGAAAAVAVPMLITADASCARLGLAATVATLTIYGLSAALIWTRPRITWMLGVASAAGMYWLAATAPVACVKEVQPSLLAAIAAPLLLLVAWWSSRFSLEQARQRREREFARIAQDAATRAAEDAARRLLDSVADATGVMRHVADAGELTVDNRRTLRCLDSTIRASVQVDPESAGTFASLVQTLVQDSARAGVPVRVLTLKDSGDRRPVPEEIALVARALLAADPEGTATVQVLTAPGEDTLLVTADLDAVRAAGITLEWQQAIDGCAAELQFDTDSRVAVLIARRPTFAGVRDADVSDK